MRRSFILLLAFAFAFALTLVGIVSWDWSQVASKEGV